jgi:hypothetical protein
MSLELTSRDPHQILQRHVYNICATSGFGTNKYNLQHPTSFPSALYSGQGNAQCNASPGARNQKRYNLQKNEPSAIGVARPASAQVDCALLLVYS